MFRNLRLQPQRLRLHISGGDIKKMLDFVTTVSGGVEGRLYVLWCMKVPLFESIGLGFDNLRDFCFGNRAAPVSDWGDESEDQTERQGQILHDN